MSLNTFPAHGTGHLSLLTTAFEFLKLAMKLGVPPFFAIKAIREREAL